MTDTRPVLVGMNNPYGADPQYALYPLPKRATGNRIWGLLNFFDPGILMSDYADAFDRRNLLTGAWDQKRARFAAMDMRSTLWGRQVVFFGAAVRDAFRLEKKPYGSLAWERFDYEREVCPFTYAHWLPHPSGLNRWYNSTENKRIAATLLGRIYRGERGLLTVGYGLG